MGSKCLAVRTGVFSLPTARVSLLFRAISSIPQNMDTNYQVGLIWSRQSQLRLIAHPNENVAFGVSIENPQQYVGNGIVTFPASFSSCGNWGIQQYDHDLLGTELASRHYFQSGVRRPCRGQDLARRGRSFDTEF